MDNKVSEVAGREMIDGAVIVEVLEMLAVEMKRRLEEKGMGGWKSRHEVLRILTEEYHEIIEAVHVGCGKELEGELFDMAVGCMFGVACIRSKVFDW